MKYCNDPNCAEINPQSLENFYTQKRINENRNQWIYYNPECKSCTKRRVKERRMNPDNYKKHVEQQRTRNLLYEVKKQKKKWRDSNKGRKNRKEWELTNKDKISEYNHNHLLHKEHEIADEEWEICKSFFNDSCAYCGITEEKAKELYNQRFHREHAINNGTNDITNCVPSCKRCNTSKWKNDYYDWYCEGNLVYSEDRLNKINKWLNEESIKIHNLIIG